MLRLRTLGAALVERNGEVLRGAASQRRVIALLALLAVPRNQGVSRDRVIGLLWPDSEPEKARQALTQALYHTRRALGEDQLFLTGADLRLNPDVITSDVAELEDALDRNELEPAVGLYTGPFLDGFHVAGAPEFERWASQEQRRLAGRCANALEQLALTAEAAADFRRAVEWRKQLAAIDPLNSRIAIGLMTAMAAAGDRAGAIQQGRVHERLLREELDVDPDAAVVELMARLRDEPTWTPAPARPPEPRPAGASVAPPDAPIVHEERKRPPRVTRRAVAIASLIGVAGAAAIVLVGRPPRPPEPNAPVVRDMIVVAPFRVAGADPTLAYLHEGMIDLLVTKLTDDQAALAADPGSVVSAWRRARLLHSTDVPRAEAMRIARTLGADRVITGSVVGTPRRVVISASLVGVVEGDLRAQATVEGTVDSLSALVDRLATRLMAREAGAWDRLATHTSASLPALRAFLDGQSAYRRGGYRDAVNHFKRALEIDSAFAMAALGLAQAAERIGARVDRDRGLATAWAARSELTERDRVYLDALAGPRYPSPPSEREQLLLWEHAAAVTPSRAEVWHELGERFFYDGQLLGIRNWEARAVAAFERAAELDPLFASPLQFLIQLAAHRGDTTAVRELAGRYLQLDSVGDLSAFVRWRAATALGDSSSLTTLRERFTTIPTVSLQLITLSSQFHAIEGRDAEQALGVLMSRAARGGERMEVHLARHALALNRGRPAAAREILDDIEDLEPFTARAARLRVLDAMYGDGDTASLRPSVVRLGGRGGDRLENACVAGQWYGWHRDSPGARQALDFLGANAPACAALLESIASVLERRPDAASRLARLDSLMMFAEGLGEMRPYMNVALARLYEAHGEPAQGLAVVRRRPHMQHWALYLSAALHHEGRLAAGVGDTTAARIARQHLLVLQAKSQSQ
jgi:DNA-binding SARP family transcriptional activator/TolB-like protein